MTIYSLSVITSTGYPYYNVVIKNLPKGIKLFLRFFDFTQERNIIHGEPRNNTATFELNAGLISALFEFARNMDKKIRSLEFISRKDDENIEQLKINSKYTGDVLITTQTETYLFHQSINEKIKLIYDNLIRPKIPLESADRITNREEEKIIDILTDAKAKDHVFNNKEEIRLLATDFLSEMGEYGLEGISIMSFDLSPITAFGKYSYKEIEVILRNIGGIPIIEPLEWKYRQSFLKGNQVWVYIINSGIGVTVEGLFEPYFYLLFADPQSYLADFPARLAREFNLVLG
ncbi:MAG: hypothetical protein ACTSQJ_11825 [Promethearchaeota archaeon]